MIMMAGLVHVYAVVTHNINNIHEKITQFWLARSSAVQV